MEPQSRAVQRFRSPALIRRTTEYVSVGFPTTCSSQPVVGLIPSCRFQNSTAAEHYSHPGELGAQREAFIIVV